MPDDIFDDDDGRVDEKAEINGAEAHEIGGDAEILHADGRVHHRQRNGERDDERRADVAENQEQDDDDQRSAFCEIRGDGMDRRLNQKPARV